MTITTQFRKPESLGWTRAIAAGLVATLCACSGGGDGISGVAMTPRTGVDLSGTWDILGPEGDLQGTITLSPSQWTVDLDGFDLTATRQGESLAVAIEQTVYCHPYQAGCGPTNHCDEWFGGRGCDYHTEYEDHLVSLVRTVPGVDELGGLPLPLGGVWAASSVRRKDACTSDATCAGLGFDPRWACLAGRCTRVSEEPGCTSTFDGETLLVECRSVRTPTVSWLASPGTGWFRATRSGAASSIFGALGGDWRVERSAGGECGLRIEGRRVEGSCTGTPDGIDGSFAFEIDASLTVLSGITHRGVEFSARRR